MQHSFMIDHLLFLQSVPKAMSHTCETLVEKHCRSLLGAHIICTEPEVKI